jgi:TPP-dependent pyruvate/acetoin dehydrogenase alpha subunit
VYRPQEEVEEWKKKCPVESFRKKLLNDGILTEDTVKQIDDETLSEVEAAVKFADQAPYPEVNNMFEDVYAPVSEEVNR